MKLLKKVQTLHQISQSCCERGTVKNPNHIKPALTCTTHGVCFLKLPKTLILKYTNFIGRNDFKFLQDRYLFTFHKYETFFNDEILNYLHLSCILHYRQLLDYSLFLHHQFLATRHYCVILFFCYKKSTSMQRNFIIEITRVTNRKMP